MKNTAELRVILMIVDALNTRTFFPLLDSGSLPNFKRLIDRGTLRERSISIFPSLTPAATSTIITGCSPREHRVFGFHWFDRSDNEVAYYGDDFWTIAELGFADFFDGCLCKLNQDHLSAATIFQKLHQKGRQCASLNFLMFQGATRHEAKVPLWFSWHPGVPFAETISGPDLLFFGDFVDSSYRLDEKSPSRKSGIFGRFGFNDANTQALLKFMAEGDQFPAFTLAYFPDHDYNSHDVGPVEGATTLTQVDSALGDFFEAYGGVDHALEQFTIVVTGDHSQSDVVDDIDEATILVEELFEGFPFSNITGWEADEVLKVFPDMRCAQVYMKYPESTLKSKIIDKVIQEPRVDQVIWKQEDRFWVTTADRGTLQFWPSDGGTKDRFGGAWNWEGSLATLSGEVRDGVVEFPDYPNAFERIHGALGHVDSGDLWLTAKVGYEFANSKTEVHVGGGSHGSLHRLDSESPLIVGGVKLEDRLPQVTRLVDVEPLCLELLGLEVGAEDRVLGTAGR